MLALLLPTIATAVDRAIAAGLNQLKKELEDQAKGLSVLKRCLSDIEEILDSHTSEQQAKNTQQYILEKLDDLENMSRRNNLRLIGLPGSFNDDSLHNICTKRIPNTLAIDSRCTVERSHCLETPLNDRCTQRPVIVRYLNYIDRVNIFKSFQNSKSLQLDVQKLLNFTDYSQEVSCRRKASQPICQALYQNGVKFTLAYPANLRFTEPSGYPELFTQKKLYTTCNPTFISLWLLMKPFLTQWTQETNVAQERILTKE